MQARAMPGGEKDAQSHLRADAPILLCTGPVCRSSVRLCERSCLGDAYPSLTWETGIGLLFQRCTCVSPERKIKTNRSSLKLLLLLDFMEEESSKIS